MFKNSLSPFRNIVLYLVVGTSSVTFNHAKESQNPVVRVMTYNACRGGGSRGNLSQSARMIELAKADIVGMQEIGDNGPKLAELLGWNYGSSFLFPVMKLSIRPRAWAKDHGMGSK